MIPICWHVITVAEGARFTVIVGETAIASFASAAEADNVCIQLAMAYGCHALPLGEVTAERPALGASNKQGGI